MILEICLKMKRVFVCSLLKAKCKQWDYLLANIIFLIHLRLIPCRESQTCAWGTSLNCPTGTYIVRLASRARCNFIVFITARFDPVARPSDLPDASLTCFNERPRRGNCFQIKQVLHFKPTALSVPRCPVLRCLVFWGRGAVGKNGKSPERNETQKIQDSDVFPLLFSFNTLLLLNSTLHSFLWARLVEDVCCDCLKRMDTDISWSLEAKYLPLRGVCLCCISELSILSS